jgi:hypothetical protein
MKKYAVKLGGYVQDSFSFFSSLYNTEVTMERRRLKSSAHQNPFTSNPLTNFAASSIIPALITKRKRPSVMIVRGSVRKMIMGFTIEFKMASTIARMIAVQKVSICTPLKIYESPKAMIEVTTMRMRNFISGSLIYRLR